MSNIFLGKYRNFSPAVKASFWFVVSNVMLRGISFVTLPIFSRILTTTEYGTVTVYSSWSIIIQIFCTLTLNGGVFNLVLTMHYEDSKKYIAAFQGLSSSLTIVFFLITMIFIDQFCYLSKLTPLLTVCMYLEIFFQMPFALWQGKQRFDYNYKPIIFITILISILNPLIGYFAVIKSEHKAEARIIVGACINIIIGLLFFIVNITQGKSFYNREIWKYAVRFNIVLVPHYLSMQILSHSDRIMINNLCGLSDSGIYGVAYSFAMLVTLVTNGINSSYGPFQYKCLKAQNYEKLRNTTSFLLLGIAGIIIILVCIIPDVFKLMLPESYYAAVWVIPPVAGAVFFMFLYPLFGTVEFYYEAKKYVAIASVIGATMNVILNFIFIKLFGFIAAAYTTLFCYIAFSVFHYFAMRIVLKKNRNEARLYDMRMIILISTALLAGIIGITVLYANTAARWCVIGVVILAGICLKNKIVGFIMEIKR